MSSLPLQQGVEQIQHHGAVLTTIEGYAQLLKSAIKAQSGNIIIISIFTQCHIKI